jgi:hypothetical protein
MHRCCCSLLLLLLLRAAPRRQAKIQNPFENFCRRNVRVKTEKS